MSHDPNDCTFNFKYSELNLTLMQTFDSMDQCWNVVIIYEDPERFLMPRGETFSGGNMQKKKKKPKSPHQSRWLFLPLFLKFEKGKEFSHSFEIIADVVVGFKMNLFFLSGNTIVYVYVWYFLQTLFFFC